MLLEKDNIRRNVRQGILTECRLRQAHSPQKISLIGNILTSGRVCRIHEIAADDKCRYAALTEQPHGLGKEVIMNGKLFQFREIRIIQGLLSKGRIPYDKVKVRRKKTGRLKALIAMA